MRCKEDEGKLKLGLYDRVALARAKGRIDKGAVGTIVDEPIRGEAFVVEFCDRDGSMLELVDVERADVVLIEKHQKDQTERGFMQTLFTRVAGRFFPRKATGFRKNRK